MLDELSALPNLTRFDVALTGDWDSSSHWHGEAVAESVIVGIIFLQCGRRMYWQKSGTPYAMIAPQAYESRPISNKLSLDLRLHYMLNLNVQFMYSVGHRDGIRTATATVSSKDYLPDIPRSITSQTGQLLTFASFDSTPITTLYVMFLAKQDVKFRRNHIWGLHKSLLANLSASLLEVFTAGRIGEFVI